MNWVGVYKRIMERVKTEESLNEIMSSVQKRYQAEFDDTETFWETSQRLRAMSPALRELADLYEDAERKIFKFNGPGDGDFYTWVNAIRVNKDWLPAPVTPSPSSESTLDASCATDDRSDKSSGSIQIGQIVHTPSSYHHLQTPWPLQPCAPAY